VNVLLVSHCDFTGNSALHVLAVAKALQAHDVSPAIAVPVHPETVDDLGRPPFPILSYAEARDDGVVFPDRRGPDLLHAFTPRENVRKLSEAIVTRYRCPYVVHFEDNEEIVLADELGAEAFAELAELPLALSDALVRPHRTHPVRGRAFLDGAAGMTALLDTLLEFKPDHVPGTVFWPGLDEALLDDPGDTGALRTELGLDPEEFVLAYTGNIHDSNLAEVRSLYLAVGALRSAGERVTLVKTGWNHVDMSWVDEYGLGEGVRELGFVPRERLWQLLGLADALVQPGGPNAFNDYRFPSKLPDFLASGKPVVLPAANIGRYLRDGVDALVLERGDATEIFAAVRRLLADPDLRRSLGSNGREFALRELRWSRNVEPIAELFFEIENRAAQRPPRAEETSAASGVLSPPAKVIAFYLPQFHAIPENDAWWGEGFTEWTNVRAAEPQFVGHLQPHRPSDLGYYDLRDAEVLDAQARLARAYGIYGFCFYYYWFNGRRILEHPLDTMLERQEPDFLFCYCWANENWTRRWDGAEQDILLAQDYSPGWAERFIRELLPVLADRRYIQVRGEPLLLVYRANVIPEVERTLETWREVAAAELGLDLHLAAVQSFGFGDPRPTGFDAAVEFPPHTTRFLVDHDRVPGVDPRFAGYLEDYRAVMHHQLALELPDYRWYRGAMPSWDNTARRGHLAHILLGSSPEAYEQWLRKLVLQALCRSSVDEPLVFVNAWNEWGEGTHLEPDEEHGRAWLEATDAALRDALRQFHASRGRALSPDGAAEHLRSSLPALDSPDPVAR